MNHDTSKDISGTITLTGEILATVYRADGGVENKRLKNIVTRYGLNRLASRGVSDTGSAASKIAVGTVTAAASLDSSVLGFGEVSRKTAAVIVQSQDWMALTMTWAGNADSLTGVVLDSVAIVDHANSGQGIAFNIANGLGVTLQASDFLNLTARIRVGSHNLGQST